MNKVTLQRDDVEVILEFIKKYPDSDFVTITVDSESVVTASLPTVINGDMVTASISLAGYCTPEGRLLISKTSVEESNETTCGMRNALKQWQPGVMTYI